MVTGLEVSGHAQSGLQKSEPVPSLTCSVFIDKNLTEFKPTVKIKKKCLFHRKFRLPKFEKS